MERRLYILANSPGEMSGWVAPVVDQVRRLSPEAQITLVLVADWFSSGREREFALQLPVQRVVGVYTLLAEVIRHRRRFRVACNQVLFLGGEALLAVLLARLMDARLIAYMPRVYHPGRFDRIFVPSEAELVRAIGKGGDRAKLTLVPALAFDSIVPSADKQTLREQFQLSADVQPVIALLLGSRPDYFGLSLDLMLEVAGLLTARFAQAQILLPVSPFIDRSDVDKHLARQAAFDSCRIRFVYANSHDALAVADLAIALPGTNNLQCAVLGVPLLVVMPLNSIEHIPFEGLLGLLYPKFFPFSLLKKYVVAWLSRRIPYLSLVNRMAGRMLAPELRAVLTPADIAQAAGDLLQDQQRLAKMRNEMLELTRERGAARMIAEGIREYYISDQRVR